MIDSAIDDTPGCAIDSAINCAIKAAINNAIDIAIAKDVKSAIANRAALARTANAIPSKGKASTAKERLAYRPVQLSADAAGWPLSADSGCW